MKYSFYLRNQLSDETCVCDQEYDREDGLIYLWTDGSFGCDCNRSIFFYNQDESKELDCNSSDEDQVIILDKIVRDDGEVIYEIDLKEELKQAWLKFEGVLESVQWRNKEEFQDSLKEAGADYKKVLLRVLES